MSKQFDAAVEAAWDAYGAGHIDQALAHAERALEIDAANGRARFAEACALERLGRLRAADRAFAQATSSPHEPARRPYRTTWRRFEKAVEAAADALPTDLRPMLEEVDIVLADHPAPAQALVSDTAEVLGLYEPAGQGQRARLHLFRRPHEHSTSTAAEFTEEVRRTLHHELGRHLGFDAGEMERRGLL